MARVSVVGCASYGQEAVSAALNEVLKPFGELEFVKPGAKIVIKANLVTMMKPESAATTHPALLKELCRLLVSRGAEVIVGDSPGGLYTPAYVNAVYAATGMKAVMETGARLNQNFTHIHAPNPEGLALKELDYTAYLDEADAIINFCKLKTHGMMGLSACVKNMFGCIPGVFKPEYHYKFPEHSDFADMLIDINERFRPKLCIVDAVTAMEGNGPTAGTPRFVGAILASDSPYACDKICAEIIGLSPDNVETVAAARRRGLEDEAEISGDYRRFIVKDFKLVRARKDMSFIFDIGLLSSLTRKALSAYPKVAPSECVGCGKCAQVCPAKAIQMLNKKPHINRKTCIRCFCCQEFCPKGAMKLKRPFIARILNR